MHTLGLGLRSALTIVLSLGALTACGDDSGSSPSTSPQDAGNHVDSGQPATRDAGSATSDGGPAAKTIVDVAFG
ncbi:MAG: hypothetical protein JWN04_5831 [Myxococcaceae bacterium]|nr:hypothetical protein [Myxococcaceae bacterium]